MAVTKIIELVGSSTTSSDDAVEAALAEAQATIRNIKALDVVSVGLSRLTTSTSGGRSSASRS